MGRALQDERLLPRMWYNIVHDEYLRGSLADYSPTPLELSKCIEEARKLQPKSQ